MAYPLLPAVTYHMVWATDAPVAGGGENTSPLVFRGKAAGGYADGHASHYSVTAGAWVSDAPIDLLFGILEPITVVANSASNGSGLDLSAGITVTLTPYAQGADLELTNNNATAAYITSALIQGQPVTGQSIIRTAEDTDSQNTYGMRDGQAGGPFTQSPEVAQALADYMIYRRKNPPDVIEVTFHPYKTAALLTQAALRELGDRITWIDAAYHLNGEYFIEGIKSEIDGGGYEKLTWTLQACSRTNVFIDSFDRPDTALTMGAPWVAAAGTWGISRHHAYAASNNAADTVLMEGAADAAVGVSMDDATCLLVVRALDANNALLVGFTTGSGVDLDNITLWKLSGGVATILQQIPDISHWLFDFPTRISVVTSGNVVSIFTSKPGEAPQFQFSYTLTGGDVVYATYTKYGLRQVAPSATAGWDNFSISSPDGFDLDKFDYIVGTSTFDDNRRLAF